MANGAIVSNMTVREKISGVADPRSALASCASIYRNEFAKRVLVANFQIRRFTAIFQILRLLADRAIGVKLVFCSGLHRPAERYVMLQPAIRAKHNVRSNYTVWTDVCPSAEFCFRMDNSRRVNLHIAHLSTKVNISSASDTI